MNKINKVNNFSQSEFVEVFGNIFEKAKWIAEELYKKKPFTSYDHLCSKMLKIFKVANKEEKTKILNAHPDLANKTKVGSLTVDSKIEQNSAGLSQCSEKEFNEFKNLNDSYKKKFNFPFILAVKDKKRVEILNEFKKRILNSNNDEFNTAIIQVMKIAKLRLNKISMD